MKKHANRIILALFLTMPIVFLTLGLSVGAAPVSAAVASGGNAGGASDSDAVSQADPPVPTAPSTAATTATTAPLGGRLIRIGGGDRIETALLVSQKGWETGGSDYVVLASSKSYADALAGVPLAGALDAPILLTGGEKLESAVLEKIKALGAGSVYLLGGQAVIGDGVEAQLREAEISVTRLSGGDRYSTAVRIADELIRLTGDSPEYVFIASSANYPDALSAGAAAAALKSPVLYCAPDSVPDAVSAALLTFCDGRVIVLGGAAALSDRVTTQLAAVCEQPVERIYGIDRYATSIAVNERFAQVFTGEDAILATGASFPDALAGGAFAVRLRSPIVLMSNEKVPEGDYEYLSRRSPKSIYILGGESALSSYAISCLVCNTRMTTTTAATTTAAAQTGKCAYLTFDDGPSDNTKRILRILDEHDAKATFFVIYRPGCEQIYKDIVKKGHTLALHSYSHDYAKIYKSETAFWNDLDKLGDYLEKTTGVRPTVMRFPGGTDNTISRKYCKGIMSKLAASADKKGLKNFDWSVDSGDASDYRPAASSILRGVKNGVGSQKHPVILMHDAPVKTTTADALPDIIRYLKDKGYKLLPITDATPKCRHKAAN